MRGRAERLYHHTTPASRYVMTSLALYPIGPLDWMDLLFSLRCCEWVAIAVTQNSNTPV